MDFTPAATIISSKPYYDTQQFSDSPADGKIKFVKSINES